MRPALLSVPALLAIAVAAQPVDKPPRSADERVAPELPAFARVADVKAILAEAALPPIPFAPPPESVPLFPYSPGTLKHYAADVSVEEILKDPEKYKFRAGVLHAYGLMRKATTTNPKVSLVTRVDQPVTDKFKKSVLATQDYVAVLVAELEEELGVLADLGSLRQDQPQRWQAHYDYAVAQLRRRAAAVHEYNKVLGDIRTESLPNLPEGSPGWRLVPAESLRSRADVKKLHAQATEGFTLITTRYKGTPWEHLATRALATQGGLAWEPIPK